MPQHIGIVACSAEGAALCYRTICVEGADFLIFPDNTIHQAMPYVLPRSPLPWLHIAEVVAAKAVERGFRRIGILGTRRLVESEVYPEKLTAPGLEYVRPNAAERDEISRII
jgi:aspartate racemase